MIPALLNHLGTAAGLLLVAWATVVVLTPSPTLEAKIRHTAGLPRKPRRATREVLTEALGQVAIGTVLVAFAAAIVLWIVTDPRDVDAWIIARKAAAWGGE
jgi:hypothetical protein